MNHLLKWPHPIPYMLLCGSVIQVVPHSSNELSLFTRESCNTTYSLPSGSSSVGGRVETGLGN